MDKLFTVPKWSAYIFLVIAWLYGILGVFGIGWGVYQGVKQNWDLVLTIIFTMPFIWLIVVLCAWVASHKKSA